MYGTGICRFCDKSYLSPNPHECDPRDIKRKIIEEEQSVRRLKEAHSRQLQERRKHINELRKRIGKPQAQKTKEP